MDKTEQIPKIKPIPAVNAVIFNDSDEILLTRRSAHIREPGKWCLPGGHFDGGESWQNAMRREVQEEVGLEVTSEVLLGLYSDPSLTISHVVSSAGFQSQFITACFIVTSFNGEVSPNEEVDKWGWFNLDNIPQPMIRSHPIRIQDAFRFEGNAFIK